MGKIVIIGAGAMGTAFAYPCTDNKHDVSIVGTHLEGKSIDEINKTHFHPSRNLERLLSEKGIKNINLSAVGGPCLASGLANRVHSGVVIANKKLDTAKSLIKMLSTDYYHISASSDINGVEV